MCLTFTNSMLSVVTLLLQHRLHGTYQICKIKYTECQKKLHTLTSYSFAYFKKKFSTIFGTKMFERHCLNVCKAYFGIETSGKHVFYKPCDYHSGRGYCTVRKVREVTLGGFGR